MEIIKVKIYMWIVFGLLFMVNIQCNDPQRDREKYYLPKTDNHYKYTSGYIEDEPLSDYTWASEKAYEDFRDMKYGIRIHWGLYANFPESDASWGVLKMPPEGKQKYFDSYKTWNPVGFDADEWMDFFEESGMKMFAFTAKHHEGFSMFDTKTRVKKRVNWIAPGDPAMEDCDLAYSIMETPFKRDVVKELCDAAHERDIKIDLYFSHPDWYDADFRPYVHHPLQVPSAAVLSVYGKDRKPETHEKRFGDQKAVLVPDPTPEETNRMIMRHRNQLKELLTNYGKIDMIGLDMWLGPTVWPQLRETLYELRKIQPDVMFRARGIGNYGDYYTPEGFVPGNQENTQMPWFVIYPLGEPFSYDPDADNYKGAKWVIKNIIDCAAKGGNFMVAIGPNENGEFHPVAVQQLKEAGMWLKTNGEAIYATRPREGELWKEGDNLRFTRTKDNNTIYIHCLEWPGDKLVLKTVKPANGSDIKLIGRDESLKWEYSETSGLVIFTPEEIKNSIPENEQLAYTFKIRNDE